MAKAKAQAQPASVPAFYVTGDEHAHSGGSTMLGFWLYLMSDCLVFAVLFATYGVLGRNYAAGPSGAVVLRARAASCARRSSRYSSTPPGRWRRPPSITAYCWSVTRSSR